VFLVEKYLKKKVLKVVLFHESDFFEVFLKGELF